MPYPMFLLWALEHSGGYFICFNFTCVCFTTNFSPIPLACLSNDNYLFTNENVYYMITSIIICHGFRYPTGPSQPLLSPQLLRASGLVCAASVHAALQCFLNKEVRVIRLTHKSVYATPLFKIPSVDLYRKLYKTLKTH